MSDAESTEVALEEELGNSSIEFDIYTSDAVRAFQTQDGKVPVVIGFPGLAMRHSESRVGSFLQSLADVGYLGIGCTYRNTHNIKVNGKEDPMKRGAVFSLEGYIEDILASLDLLAEPINHDGQMYIADWRRTGLMASSVGCTAIAYVLAKYELPHPVSAMIFTSPFPGGLKLQEHTAGGASEGESMQVPGYFSVTYGPDKAMGMYRGVLLTGIRDLQNADPIDFNAKSVEVAMRVKENRVKNFRGQLMTLYNSKDTTLDADSIVRLHESLANNGDYCTDLARGADDSTAHIMPVEESRWRVLDFFQKHL